ncbi:probable G-protein coupled receptor Mth-like 5 [Cylas formicarius]|uniref:probable G-protein coupled receptor Mth-like 5 n=1 Tax=Cylas formicarius TaxID=197179 RepID=UPI0029584CBA|nr:probable G-protein coupled receptor Mth-like 5 [Cylas formicarius]
MLLIINILTLLLYPCNAGIGKNVNARPEVLVNKCCLENDIYIGKYCKPVEFVGDKWSPLFTSEKGISNLQVKHKFVFGLPDCGHTQPWPIYHYQNSTDKLRLLPNGVLRHYFDHQVPEEFDFEMELIEGKNLYQDYEQGKYCMDKKKDEIQREFAWVCPPDHKQMWTTNEFLMHNVVNPISHGITIIFLLMVAVIYFVMPTLRDLTGNIVTTMCMCLIVNQTADLIRLLTVFKSHISLFITETICYISLLGAFFWLNSLGYYIWRTFRSRNVFLRITDGKKYCYYGSYAWSCTLILGCLAVFAHFTMDYQDMKPTLNFDQQQEQIGSLGMIIFFVPIAFTVLVDVFFIATTLKKINRMHTYGRIHHKLRHSFRMFLLLLLTMTLCWLFFLSSFSKYEGLINSHIIVNTFQGPTIFYICVFNQKHVSYLLRKTCCYENCICPCCRPDREQEWGDEMTAMHTQC